MFTKKTINVRVTHKYKSGHGLRSLFEHVPVSDFIYYLREAGVEVIKIKSKEELLVDTHKIKIRFLKSEVRKVRDIVYDLSRICDYLVLKSF